MIRIPARRPTRLRVYIVSALAAEAQEGRSSGPVTRSLSSEVAQAKEFTQSLHPPAAAVTEPGPVSEPGGYNRRLSLLGVQRLK